MKLSLTHPIVALLALAPAARAGDIKQYPGAACLESGVESGDLQRSGMRITNYGATHKTLVCPAARDIQQVCSSGGGSIHASVNIMDNHDANIACTLAVRRNDGAILEYSTVVGAFKTPGMRTIPVEVPFYADDDYFTLECELPPNGPGGTARIYSYAIEENFGC